MRESAWTNFIIAAENLICSTGLMSARYRDRLYLGRFAWNNHDETVLDTELATIASDIGSSILPHVVKIAEIVDGALAVDGHGPITKELKEFNRQTMVPAEVKFDSLILTHPELPDVRILLRMGCTITLTKGMAPLELIVPLDSNKIVTKFGEEIYHDNIAPITTFKCVIGFKDVPECALSVHDLCDPGGNKFNPFIGLGVKFHEFSTKYQAFPAYYR